MTTATAIRRRRTLAAKGLGLPGDNTAILALARRLRTSIDAPAVGGLAVYLHGVPRATIDLDLYTTDRRATAHQLEAAGAVWRPNTREHVLDGIPIRTVTPDETGVTIVKVSTIDGIRVVTLQDLIAMKLNSGLHHLARHKDLGDVEELIRAVPLDKRFAAKLPPELRADFKSLVDAVRQSKRHPRHP